MPTPSVRELFNDALARPAEERAAFLDQACAGDAALRAKVEELLAVHDGGRGSLANPSAAAARAVPAPPPQGTETAAVGWHGQAQRGHVATSDAQHARAFGLGMPPGETAAVAAALGGSLPAPAALSAAGRRIGPYKLLQLIGEGGFGSVYMAEQETPVRRRVALKIIKPGMDSRMVIARFEAERQALALMDHPHIARVFDGGVTDASLGARPYFVMEYVKGDPITTFADAHKLSLTDRLGLFTQVCQAVQHAHTKGVIHRDIKPSNVLATMTDGKPYAKVIDFGIAKATGARLTDKTLFTEHRALMGTPQYMSPEQAERSPDIDTRTDVYALGVLLYELLSGATPFDGKRLRSAAFAEMQRIIKEEDPPAPSLRLSRDLATLAATAAARQAEPAKLGTLIKGELDWIVMKALDKDRARRYESPDQLAADVQRHLAGEAVVAAPPSTAYRLRKFVRRHRAPVIAAGLVTVALVLGIVGTTGGLIWANHERRQADLARQAEASEKEKALAAGTEAAKQRDEADRQRDAAEFQAYAANIAAADAALRANDIASARQRLSSVPERSRNHWEWLYLNARTDNSIGVLAGHRDWVSSVVFSPNGRHVVTTGVNDTPRVWEVPTARELFALSGYTGDIGVARYSPDGKLIAAAANDGAVRVWDAQTGTLRRTLPTDFVNEANVLFSPDGERLLAAGNLKLGDASVVLWDLESGNELIDWRLRWFRDEDYQSRVSQPPPNLTLAPDARRVLIQVQTQAVLLDLATGQDRLRIVFEEYPFLRSTISPDGRFLLTPAKQRTAKLWDAETGEQLFELSGHAKLVTCGAFSPDSQLVVTGSFDGSAMVWDARSGSMLRALRGHESEVRQAAFSPDGRRVATASSDGMIILWDTESGLEAVRLHGHAARVSWLEFDRAGQYLATESHDGTIRIWDAETESYPATFRDEDDSTFRAFTPGSNEILVADYSGWTLWDTYFQSATKSTTIPTHVRYPMAGASFSPDGRRFVTTTRDRYFGHEDCTAHVWDLVTGTEVGTLRGHTQYVGSATWSPDGRFIATGGYDDTARIWDASTGQQLATLKHSGGVSCVSFSPDGERLVTTQESLARLWETQTGREVLAFSGHTDGLRMACFSPDGARLMTGGFDGSAKLWDVTTGLEIATLRAHSFAKTVADGTFSPDGERVVLVYVEGGSKLWDVGRGQELLTFGGDTDSVGFSSDGTRLGIGRSVLDTVPYAVRYRERHEALAAASMARTVVDGLFDSLGDVSRVLDALERDRSLGDPVRRQAVSLTVRRALASRAALLEQATPVVEALMRKEILIERVVGRLQSQESLTDDVRRVAIEIAQHDGDDPERLYAAAWEIAKDPRADTDQVAVAVAAAERAVQPYPKNSAYLTALGAAPYRANLFADARATLLRGDALSLAAGTSPTSLVESDVPQATSTTARVLDSGRPATVAFLTMSYAQLGKRAEAQASLARLRELMRDSNHAANAESQAFLAEAEALIEGRPDTQPEAAVPQTEPAATQATSGPGGTARE